VEVCSDIPNRRRRYAVIIQPCYTGSPRACTQAREALRQRSQRFSALAASALYFAQLKPAHAFFVKLFGEEGEAFALFREVFHGERARAQRRLYVRFFLLERGYFLFKRFELALFLEGELALTLSLGPNGILLELLGLGNFNFYGFWGTFISETLTFFPVAFMTLSTILSRIDPNLEDAAYSLGASSFKVFRSVTLPLAAPGIANAFLLVFSCSLADFATPQVLGGHSFPVLPTQAYLQITGMYDFKGGSALSFMLLIPAIAVYLLQRYWVGKKSYVTVSGKAGGRSSVKGPGLLLTTGIAGVVVLVSAFILYLYAIILTASVVKIWGINNQLTLEHYEYVFTYGMKAIKDTLLIACIGTPVGGLLAVLVGYATARLKVRGHRTLETVSLLNYTLPGTVVGIAYIIAFNDKPIVLTGTLYILVAAYVFRYSSAGIRNVIAALTQIDPSIEEASRSLGASAVKTFTSVTVPLVLPAILAGMRYLFIHSMTAISATIFLVSVHWTLITTRILECMTELQFAQACAFSIVLIGLVFIASGVMNLIARMLCRNGDAIGVH